MEAPFNEEQQLLQIKRRRKQLRPSKSSELTDGTQSGIFTAGIAGATLIGTSAAAAAAVASAAAATADKQDSKHGSTKQSSTKIQLLHLADGRSGFPCPLCPVAGDIGSSSQDSQPRLLPSRRALTEHLRSHNTWGCCAVCGKCLSSASSLDRHMLTHSDERPYACPLCPAAFTTNGNMLRHLGSAHKTQSAEHELLAAPQNKAKQSKKVKLPIEAVGLPAVHAVPRDVQTPRKVAPKLVPSRARPANRKRPRGRVTLHPGAYFNRLPSLRAARRLRRRYLQLLHHHSQAQSVSLTSSSRKRVNLTGMSQTREGKRGRRESSVLHRCDQCNRKCFGKKNLVIHRATCHGTPPQKTIYCCLGRMQDGAPCGEKDEDLATMKRHVMINHIKIDPYICKLCNPGAIFTVGLDDKHLHKQHGSFCTRENAHRHLLQQSSHEYIADMRRRLNPNSDDTSTMRDQKLDQWRSFAAHVKKEFCGVVRVSDDLKQRLIGDENSSCNVCQLDLGSPEALRSHFEARPSCEIRFACPHCSHDLLGPEQFLEHLKVKHLDCSTTEPRACVTKKVVWLKRPRQRPTKTAEEQPLDLSVAAVAASVTAKDESTVSAINDSGCPQTPAKDAAVLNPFLSAWTSPLWPGLFTWPFSYPPQLLAPSTLPAIDTQAAAAVAAAAAAAATSTPAIPEPVLGDAPTVSSASSGISKLQRRSEEASDAAATPGRASSLGCGGGNSNSDSESDAGPLKKKAKKNSYKDAPNLIFCPFSNCKQSFPWMSSLKRHIITHTSHKPYCCTRCSQSFSTKSNRERHMERIHHIKVKGKVKDNPHAALSSEELSTFFEHDKVAEKIGEELLNQLGNNVVTSVNPQRLLHRADCDQDSACDKDSALSASPGGSGGHQSLSASGASAAATAAAIVSAEVASLRSVYKCPECQFASGNRRDALEHLRSRHGEVWQLVAARSRLATVDAVMADGAAAPCSDEDEADDEVSAGKAEEARIEDEFEDNDEAVAAFGAVHTEEEEDNADEDDDDAGSAEGNRLLCLVCSARLWSRRQLRGHMRGHTGCKPHRCSLCSRAFRLRQTLCRHLFARHPEEMLKFRRKQMQSAEQQGLLFQPWQPFQLDQQKSISRRESPINLRIDTGSSSS